ncbi:chaperone NapD [Halovulum sp. GXIMD14794]
MNICGCLVHVSTAQVADARGRLDAMHGVEVYAASDDGRLVVVVEDTEAASAADLIMEIHQVPGVISVTLNYHHFEDVPPRAASATLSSRRTDA